MAEFTPPDADYAGRVRDSFTRQGFKAYIGAELTDLGPGRCAIRVAYRQELSQQHAFFHGGVIGPWPTTPAAMRRSP